MLHYGCVSTLNPNPGVLRLRTKATREFVERHARSVDLGDTTSDMTDGSYNKDFEWRPGWHVEQHNV